MNKTAYVIDDEKSWRDHYQRWLSQMNFQIISFDSLESFNKKFYSDSIPSPDIALIDMSLSNEMDNHNLNGLTIISLFKEYHPKCKLVLATGYPNEARYYFDDVDLVLRKRDWDRKIALTKKVFISQIEPIINSI